MSGPRCSVLLGLVLLLVSMGPCQGSIESRELTNRQTLLSIIMEIVEGLKNCNLEDYKRLHFFSKPDFILDESEVTDYVDGPEGQRAEIVARDLRMKDKFIKHLTGPLYFSPKCSKHFHRIYHNTRDCTIPAHYKRCARLLTRLAVSPVCKEG
ncbi:PREDICTED: protein FAM150B-like [Chrysochloris asiatica]|uniref:Protein FAM150B-like n=1 Tax=Chrysochloris asiatica TaxID=185453 RepID=A0A9B0THP8_CHRAS|nr:PREDICTED: protein FAM150B-like [Chrysochloris asiatica]